MRKTIEQTSLFALPILEGEVVSLMPFFDVFDLDDFVRLHREDTAGYMCRFCLKNLTVDQGELYIMKLIELGDIFIWTVVGKESGEKFGFIYLSNVDGRSASLTGIMDRVRAKPFASKLTRSIADDATIAVLDFCFKNGFERISGDATHDNRQAIALHNRIGFVREGTLREAIVVDGKPKHIVLVSILKGEWNHGQDKTAEL